jgi:hypothetical protein
MRFLLGEGSAHARLDAACRLPAARAHRWPSAQAGGAGVMLAAGGPWVVACAARSRAVIGIARGSVQGASIQTNFGIRT